MPEPQPLPDPYTPTEEPWLTRAELATVLQLLGIVVLAVAGFMVAVALGLVVTAVGLFLVGHALEGDL